ncbi:MAG TPA: macrocin-O-methyltransferase, partial [Treponema sp.]|nr:macrocin-O-methyltransferase [Treponema sp.]
VNLDMDLYTPTLAALEFFLAHMDEGCILMHDYFSPNLTGIKKAVDDFEVEIHKTIPKLPIGDEISIALIKQRM